MHSYYNPFVVVAGHKRICTWQSEPILIDPNSRGSPVFADLAIPRDFVDVFGDTDGVTLADIYDLFAKQ